MHAVGVVFSAQLRNRWRSWLAVAILISLVGGAVMAAAAAGRRTQSAFPGFVMAHGFDAEVYSSQPLPSIAGLPGVSAATELRGADNGQPTCACRRTIDPSNLGVALIPTTGRSVFNLVSGRMPDPSNPHEVLASYTLQQDAGVHLGTVIHIPFFSRSQVAADSGANGPPPVPAGPKVDFRVVGFEATEFEFPAAGTNTYLLYATAAFAHRVLPQTGSGYLYFIRLRHGLADVPRFQAAVNDLGPTVFVQNVDSQVASVEASIHPQAIGWWLLAALAALVGLTVVGQAIGRQSLAESEEFPTMIALGMKRRHLVVLGTLRNLGLGLTGAIGAVAIAALLSPIAPLGEARVAESSTGITFDRVVLLIGSLGVVFVVIALGLWPAMRAARGVRDNDRVGRDTPSALTTGLWSIGAPMSLVIGVRNALERRTVGASVPVASALLGTVLAVIALCGTAVFGASLSHLTATPALYGDPFQLNISNSNGGTGKPDPALLKSVENDPAVTGITQGIALPAISINKVVVGALAGTPVRGPLLMSLVLGHLPSGAGEVGLGAATMRQTGAHLGSVVPVTVSSAAGRNDPCPFRVVAQVSLPVVGNAVSLGNGALFTLGGYEGAACPPGPERDMCRQEVAQSSDGGMLVNLVDGPRRQLAIKHYLAKYGSITALAITPMSLINFGEAVNFPLVFGAMLAVFGAATLLHLLLVSVTRRRREVGLLKVVGFVNGQVASTVACQATTLAVVGIVIGVPLGIVIGRATWLAFANNLGAVPVAVVPPSQIALLALGVLIAANLIAVAPALVATRFKPADLLRAS